ncbi:DegV domain-containing protein, partial [Clarias magur]
HGWLDLLLISAKQSNHCRTRPVLPVGQFVLQATKQAAIYAKDHSKSHSIRSHYMVNAEVLLDEKPST